MKDDVNRRITVIFRGTDNAMAGKSNWLTNLNAMKKKVPMPNVLEGKVDVKNLGMHDGFYGKVDYCMITFIHCISLHFSQATSSTQIIS